ncbi:MAG: ABC transporter permease [Planctomycetota bacterium]|jgi:ABC-type transport system involved in multi-copper enzyme maturation permease subunit|nr:ABC transporter permease [Planctomycetota bacterium]
MGKVFQIAKNTFREAVRDRILYVVAFFALMMLIGSVAFGWISIVDQLQVVQDMSLAVLSFFCALMAVFIGAGLVHKEIEKRTIYTILSKPVQRWQFLLGKYLGLMAVLGLALLGMLAAALLFVAYAAGNSPDAVEKPWTSLVHWDWYIAAGTLIFFELLVVVALATLFGSLANPTLSAIFTFTAYLIGQVSSTIQFMFTKFQPMSESVANITGEELTDFVSRTYFIFRPLSIFLFYVLPDLRHFQLRNQVALGPPPTVEQFLLAVAYGICYSAAVLAVATLIFGRKRF